MLENHQQQWSQRGVWTNRNLTSAWSLKECWRWQYDILILRLLRNELKTKKEKNIFVEYKICELLFDTTEPDPW
jgi:hypothetical protein